MSSTKDILSYWYDIEFFSPYWPTTDKDTIKIVNTNYSLRLPWQSPNLKQNRKFEYDIFLGKIDNDRVINKIYNLLKLKDDSIERNSQNSCISSFKVDFNGAYIPGSFCLSTYAWSMSRIIEERSLDITLLTSEHNDLTAYLDEVITTIFSGEDKNKIVTPEHLKKIFSLCLNTLNMDSYDVKFYAIINKNSIPEIIVEDIYIKNPNTNAEEKIKIENNMLKSFYVDDLGVAKENINHLSYKTLNYINSLFSKPTNRINIDNNVEEMKKVLCVDNYPLGKWPSMYSPSLMQQIGINLAISKDVNQDIFSINGPPGTGKTTLLKEIIASYIVDRSLLLCNCTTPDDLFKEAEYTDKSKYVNKYYIPNKELVKYGIIVASNNNSAVENISKELPLAKDTILKKCNTALFDIHENTDIYFSDISDSLSKELETWGLISAPLGKFPNISTFNNAIWFNNEKSLRLKMKEPNKPSFIEAKKLFIQKYNEVHNYRNIIKDDKKIFAKIKNAYNQLENQKLELTEIINKKNNLQLEIDTNKNIVISSEKNISKINNEIKHIDDTEVSYQDNIDLLWNRLNIFQKYLPFLFKNNAIIIQINKIKCLLNELPVKKSELLLAIENEKIVIHEIQKTINVLELKMSSIQSKVIISEELLNKYNKSYIELLNKEELLKDKYGKNFADSNFWQDIQNNKASQSACPFTTIEYDTLREELFYYALNLQKAFVLNSKSIFVNLQNIVNFWTNNMSSVDAKKSYAHLLNTLMIVVPVISTTLASVGNFLNVIGENELGTLIIDEAGQATPQSAVGAIRRCQKVIIVGDPLQIEPIVTIPKAIQKRIADKYSIDNNYLNNDVSVQSFADYINIYGGERNIDFADYWLGCPLVVHRRCIEPMFSISNNIAYNDKMFNETKQPSNDIKLSMEKSYWLNIAGKEFGSKNHYVKEQGEEVVKLVLNAFKTYDNNSVPNLYVISPFTSVTHEIRRLLKSKLLAARLLLDKSTIDTWLKNNCGTIHTFQGKEANEVIIVLGCDKNSGLKAAEWVGRKPNILNVAISRAKYRCVIIGDKNLWKNVNYINTSIKFLDCLGNN